MDEKQLYQMYTLIAVLGLGGIAAITVIYKVIQGFSRPRCPYCRRRLQRGATVCSHCGAADILRAPKAPKTPEADVRPHQKGR